MKRRDVLKLGAGFGTALTLARHAILPDTAFGASSSDTMTTLSLGDSFPFSDTTVIDKARLLSQSPYVPPKAVPDAYKNWNYDQYRAIRFKKDLAIWKSDKLDFNAELFSAGYIYATPVEIFLVESDRAAAIRYDPSLFSYGPQLSPPGAGDQIGFSGFRFHTPINRADVFDEFTVFQGASYFRAKSVGQDYGLSARGLAINTGQPPADEFPIFRSYWLVKPSPGVSSVTVFALLDSVSVSGAYKFVISPLQNTVMDVECTLFPRRAIPYAGIAPLTSMFYFAPSNKFRADEVRQRVHDSDGLSIWNWKDEHIWRPLINSATRIQFSAFADQGVKGFGLVQRERRPDRYQDFDAHYELRPTVWVEPKGSWGEGSVDLVELPTQYEYFDNIVASWRPKEPLQAGTSYSYRYRLTWAYDAPIRRNFATVSQTLTGASTQHEGMRLFYIDFEGTEDLNVCDELDDFCTDKNGNVELSASAGAIVNVAIRRNSIAGGHRVGFEYQPAPGSIEADLRCAIVSEGKPVSEVWIYRWTA